MKFEKGDKVEWLKSPEFVLKDGLKKEQFSKWPEPGDTDIVKRVELDGAAVLVTLENFMVKSRKQRIWIRTSFGHLKNLEGHL